MALTHMEIRGQAPITEYEIDGTVLGVQKTTQVSSVEPETLPRMSRWICCSVIGAEGQPSASAKPRLKLPNRK